MQMRGLDNILFLPKFQALNLTYLFFSFINKPFISLHGPNSTHLLISLNPLFLELFNSLLELNSNPFIGLGKLNNSHKSVLGLDSEFTKTVIKCIQFRVVGDTCVGDMDLLVLIFVHGDQTTALALALHLLENLYQTFELLLEFLA